MAGFRKAKAEQAAVKLGIYGPSGSGKTFTSLLVAEGLAAASGKRIAFVDTEHGTDFYAMQVPARKVHPEAFDFDALYGRSITELLESVNSLDTNVYGVLVIDSISHVWDAAVALYKGKTTKIGTIPLNAWGEIKRPYKELMAKILSLPIHVVICGRQKNEFAENDEGEMKKVGVAMRAEGETQYEPHICVRMEATRSEKGKPGEILAVIEKDRTGVLTGKTIPSPTFDTLIKPVMNLLGSTQAKIETEEETGQRDADVAAKQENEKAAASQRMLVKFRAEMDKASLDGVDALNAVSKQLTPQVKRQMLAAHVSELREHYTNLCNRINHIQTVEEVR